MRLRSAAQSMARIVSEEGVIAQAEIAEARPKDWRRSEKPHLRQIA